MRSRRSGLVRLGANLRKKSKKDKYTKDKNKTHARGGATLPADIDDKERLRQIIINRRNNYKDILGDSDIQADALVGKNPENVTHLLQIADAIEAKKGDFIIVGDIKTTLPLFRSTFSKAPFYVLSVDAPDVSFAFSALINEMGTDSALHKKAALESLWAGGQNKANDFNSKLQKNIEDIKASGFSKTRDIIDQLNKQGFKTRRGENWEKRNFSRAQQQIEKIQSLNAPK